MAGRFFQIDRDAWLGVGDLGLNAAIAYLVLACGTGRDNRTTAWSVNAIEKYTGIGRSSAKRAVAALIINGFLSQTLSGGKPRYRFSVSSMLATGDSATEDTEGTKTDTNWIWLPNSLVTGVAGEAPPIERVRALHEPRTLSQLIDLYDAQDLAENGGIPWRHIRKNYKRERITERGVWVIWGFVEGGLLSWPHQSAWRAFNQKQKSKAAKDLQESDFWESFKNLERLGLLECVPHLIEADTEEAMMICPCPSP